MNYIKKIINSYKDPLYRNSHYLMLNSILSSFLGFIFWIVVARNFSAYDVGLATALISVASIISIFSTFGLDNSTIRFLANEKEKQRFINSALTIISFISIILSVIFLLGINLWAPKLNFLYNSSIYIILFLIYNITTGLFLIANSTFIALRDTKYVLFQNVLVNLLRIPMPFFLVFILGGFSIFASFTLSLIITIFISILILFKKVIPDYKPSLTFDKQIYKNISHFSAVNYFSTLFGNLPPFIIPLIILAFLSPEQNAYYYMVFTIASVLFIIPGANASSLLAEGAHDESKFFSNLKKTLKHTYMVLIPAVILIILFGSKLLLIFGEDYESNGSLLLYIYAISTFFIALNLIYVTYLRIRMKISQILILTPASSTLIVIISYILIPKIGILGSGLAYLISMGLMSIYIIFYLIKNELQFREIFKKM